MDNLSKLDQAKSYLKIVQFDVFADLLLSEGQNSFQYIGMFGIEKL